MQLKLKKISTKSFVVIFLVIKGIACVILGALVTIASLISPNEEGAALASWAILIFPVLNGILGVSRCVFYRISSLLPV